jgi:LAGLIDADG DNA endonuclease family protein
VDPWYVTGIAEAWGRFTFTRARRIPTLLFELRVREPDLQVAEGMRRYFGAGKLYRLGTRGRTVCIRITGRHDLQRVADHFESYPLIGAKRDAVAVWTQMVRLKAGSFRRPPIDELERLAARLSEYAHTI